MDTHRFLVLIITLALIITLTLSSGTKLFFYNFSYDIEMCQQNNTSGLAELYVHY